MHAVLVILTMSVSTIIHRIGGITVILARNVLIRKNVINVITATATLIIIITLGI